MTMTKVKKSTWIIIAVIAVLVIGIAVFLILNSSNMAEKKDLESNAQFKLSYNGASTTVSMNDLLALNPVEFEATMDTSDTDPTPVKFTGVEIKKILQHYSIDASSITKYEVLAIDGYASAFTKDEIMADGNVYIVFKKNGSSLGTKTSGGTGPYMVVSRNDQFSIRWCKYVSEIKMS